MKIILILYIICLTAMLWLSDLFIKYSYAETINGNIINEKGESVENALVILYKIAGDDRDNVVGSYLTAINGKYLFNVGEKPGHYKIIIYNNGKIKEKEIDYQGINRVDQITIGGKGKWYEFKKIPDKLWTFLSLLFSFILGLSSKEILEKRERRRIQKNITMFYNESIGEFQKAISTIDRDDGEEKYLSIKEKLSLAKSNLQMLLSYSWAVEKLKPIFYLQLQNKYNLIKQIEHNPPFKEMDKYFENLEFLMRYEKGITKAHKIFKESFDDLKMA